MMSAQQMDSDFFVDHRIMSFYTTTTTTVEWNLCYDINSIHSHVRTTHLKYQTLNFIGSTYHEYLTTFYYSKLAELNPNNRDI